MINIFKNSVIPVVTAIAIASASSAAQAQAVQPDPPYLTQSGWILARGTGFAARTNARIYVTATVHGVGGTPYGGSMPGDAFGLARGQGSVRCLQGRGTYYTKACAWEQLPSGAWSGGVCRVSPNRIISCG